ncbi:uncharacterized protein M421DRAFT_130367 [Didymella exigua CBS 183.55]|uniref:Uncharacterized protein n=1 Tax=Didymella exigua CBS 183.55 TaxID=1150837 RepID=A0A6A5RRZ1_9PLEO|nr:uncharacterized protein M421DRAFT_130367 [Didymella exigua CBS 183.55]KAF1929824.1 hypothetical protein M421DRAFT_130367 [Didymella exigua CBS 183.55]
MKVYHAPAALIADLRLSTRSHGPLAKKREILSSSHLDTGRAEYHSSDTKMASAIDYEKHRDSSSLDGKIDGHGVHDEVVNPLSDLPDPDAGLSDQERAAADKKLLRKLDLKLIPWLSFLYLICECDATTSAQHWLTTDASLPRQNQHRQRESRRSAAGSENDQRAIQCHADNLLCQLRCL